MRGSVSAAARALEPQATAAFLREIGYLVPVGPAFTVTTTNVDPEVATVAGPQLVVPVDNPRYALNAANARWGSLYDALYGTNVIAEDDGAEKGRGYNPVRGERVIAKANEFLDQAVPLAGAEWADVTGLDAAGGRLACRLRDGRSASLADAAQFVGLRRAGNALTNVLLRHHGLHIDIVIDPTHPIGRQHPAGVKDVVLESALTTIMDCEDSVATVDAADKTVVYRNWCGIMRGTLAASVAKGSGTIERRLNADRRIHGTERRDGHAAGAQLAARSPRRLARADRRRHRQRGPTDCRNLPRLRADDARGAARLEGI